MSIIRIKAITKLNLLQIKWMLYLLKKIVWQRYLISPFTWQTFHFNLKQFFVHHMNGPVCRYITKFLHKENIDYHICFSICISLNKQIRNFSTMYFQTRGQSYKYFYNLGQIYKRVLKHLTMPCVKFLFVILLGYYYLTYL